jgi:branched-chain amino acid transport system substrate-binding protein
VSRKLLSVLGALTVGVVFAACSSSTHSSTPTTAGAAGGTTGSSSAHTTGAAVKIGEVCSCSGQPGFSEYSVDIQDSVKAWADSVNAAGGIAGHPVQLITEDDATNPGTSVSDAQTLVSDHVAAIIDDTTLVTAWASQVEAANIPVVGTDSINPPFDTSPDFYAEGQTNATTLQAVVAVAKQAGGTKLGLMYCAEAPVCAQSVPLMQSAGKAAGVPDVYNASIAATAPNYTSQCIAAKQAGVNAMFVADAGTIIQHFASDCATQGYYPAYITEAAGFTLAQASSPGLSKNLWSQYPDLPFWQSSAPAVQEYNTAMDKYEPGVRENNNVMNEDAFMGWVSAKLIQAGVQNAGVAANVTPTAADVTKGLNSVKNDSLGGLAPALSFTSGQDHHINCYFTAHIENGKPALVNNGQASCINPSS